MKTFKLYIFVSLIGMFSLTSCEDYFGSINVDPDNPISVTPNVILPQIQVRLAYVVGGDASRYVGIYTQHVDGAGRQFAVIQNYGIVPADCNTIWGQNFYSSIMMDNRQLLAVAEEEGYNHYIGISKAIEAYSMMMVTDYWGDAPYSQAFQGTDLIQPAFDSQESIYAAIFSLIDQARSAFQADDGGFAPGSADLIYGGDTGKWERFLNTLEARGRLHLGKVDANNYNLALGAINKGALSAGSDDARLFFGSGATESAPWFQYNEQRTDIVIGDSYVAMMEGLNDPRAATYGYPLDDSGTHPILTRTRGVPLISFTEAKFIEAEAAFQTGDNARAQAAYLEGIEASFTDALVEGYDDYIAQESVVPAGGVTLNEIMTQKYIALFAEPEVFNDWRRTGIPTLDPNTGAQVPRRLPYAENEILSNPNTPSPAQVTIFSRVWWDK